VHLSDARGSFFYAGEGATIVRVRECEEVPEEEETTCADGRLPSQVYFSVDFVHGDLLETQPEQGGIRERTRDSFQNHRDRVISDNETTVSVNWELCLVKPSRSSE